MNSPLYYIHYPRTGGTSLREMLIAQLGLPAAQICPWRAWREVDSVEPLWGYQFYSGHFGGYGLDSVLGEYPTFVATIRHPWKQLQSGYRYVMAGEGVAPTAQKKRRLGLSFRQYLEILPGNSMCLFYAADGPAHAQIGHLTDPYNPPTISGTVTDQHKALGRLLACQWIINTDAYAVDFWRVFGTEPDRRLNAPQYEFKATADDRAYVEDKWMLDIELLSWLWALRKDFSKP